MANRAQLKVLQQPRTLPLSYCTYRILPLLLILSIVITAIVNRNLHLDAINFGGITRAVSSNPGNISLIPSEDAVIPILYNSFVHSPRQDDNSHNDESPPPISMSVQKDWQNVTNSNYKFSVYSAYKLKGKQEVLIIATTKTFTEEVVQCLFHFELDGSMSEATPGIIETMGEHWKKNYSGVFIRCPLPMAKPNVEVQQLPHSVSVIIASVMDKPGNVVQIQYHAEDTPNFEFSVCVLPAFGYNQVFHFVEWMEFYKLMGVRQFTFYNVSFGVDTSCVLNEYKKAEKDTGVRINIYPWFHYPVTKYGEIRSGPCAQCGLSAATNDCVYRHRGSTKYMIFADFDEFIMPRNATSYGELFQLLSPQSLNISVPIGFYSIRNGFFGMYRKDDDLRRRNCAELKKTDYFAYQVCQNMLLVKKSLKEFKNNEHRDRSKYILKPEGVKEAGNHVFVQMEPGYQAFAVSEKIAISRHYRYIEGFWQISNNTRAVRDPIRPEFGEKVAVKVAERVEYLFDKCNLNIKTFFKD